MYHLYTYYISWIYNLIYLRQFSLVKSSRHISNKYGIQILSENWDHFSFYITKLTWFCCQLDSSRRKSKLNFIYKLSSWNICKLNVARNKKNKTFDQSSATTVIQSWANRKKNQLMVLHTQHVNRLKAKSPSFFW